MEELWQDYLKNPSEWGSFIRAVDEQLCYLTEDLYQHHDDWEREEHQ